MYSWLIGKIARHLEKLGITTDNEIHTYLISFVAAVFCLITHIYLLAAYLIGGVTVFAIFNLASICVYCLLMLLHRRRRYKAIALIITVDVTIYATISILLSGIETYIVGYYLLVVILQVILPYAPIRLRAGVIAGVVAVGLPPILFSFGHAPIIATSLALTNFLTISNIYILFFGTLFQLCIGNVVKRIVRQLNESRMENLSTLANTDPLTGLFNRRYAEFCFAHILETRRNVPYCVAMLDIDNFKEINDTYGHACGDEVLVYLANLIVSSLRKTDIVFRWGGEEFLMLLENVDISTAYTILEKMREKLELSAIPTAAATLAITATIGVTTLDTQNPMQSIQASDQNLYTGKQKGKNMVVAG